MRLLLRLPRRALCLYRPMLAEPLWRMVSGSLRTSELPREEDFQRLAAFCEKPQGVRQEWLSSPLPPPWGNAAPVSGLRSLRILCPAPWVWARAQLLCPPAPASRAASLGLGFLLGVSGEHSGKFVFSLTNETTGPKKSRALVGPCSCWCAHRGCRRWQGKVVFCPLGGGQLSGA